MFVEETRYVRSCQEHFDTFWKIGRDKMDHRLEISLRPKLIRHFGSRNISGYLHRTLPLVIYQTCRWNLRCFRHPIKSNPLGNLLYINNDNIKEIEKKYEMNQYIPYVSILSRLPKTFYLSNLLQPYKKKRGNKIKFNIVEKK